jgi:hypothetical protein
MEIMPEKVTVRMEGTRKDGKQRRRKTGEVRKAWKIIGNINGLTMARERRV